MRAIALAVALAGCTDVYEGEHTAAVTTTIVLGGAPQTITASERVEIAEGDLTYNELLFRREDGCELRMFKRGGFGLRFATDQDCERAGVVWTLREGGAPNERGDELVIELAWDIVDGDRAGTADEQLRIAR